MSTTAVTVSPLKEGEKLKAKLAGLQDSDPKFMRELGNDDFTQQ